MIKLLAFADDPACPTGFGKVSDHVLYPLSQTGEYEIHLCALNYQGDSRPHERYPYRYYAPWLSAKVDMNGVHRMDELIDRVKPDVIWVFNDVPIVSSYYHASELLIDQCVVSYSPVDGHPFPYRYLEGIREVTIPIVYTEYAKTVITEMDAYLGSRLEVIPHGHDPKQFYPLGDTKEESKRNALEGMAGPDPDWFIVLRVDKNQTRKNWPATLRVFARFAEDKPDTRLWIHTVPFAAGGYDIPVLCEMLGIADKILNSGLTAERPGIATQALNYVYNMADVHFSTTIGGGWELSTHEAKAAGTPTIITDYAAMAEVARVGGIMVPPDHYDYAPANSTRYAHIDEDAALEALNKLYYDKELRAKLRREALEWAKGATWEAQHVAERFGELFGKAVELHREEMEGDGETDHHNA